MIDIDIKELMRFLGVGILLTLGIGYCAWRIRINGFEEGYKEACVDFYKGKQKYDLVKHEDGTVTWEKINKGCKNE